MSLRPVQDYKLGITGKLPFQCLKPAVILLGKTTHTCCVVTMATQGKAPKSSKAKCGCWSSEPCLQNTIAVATHPGKSGSTLGHRDQTCRDESQPQNKGQSFTSERAAYFPFQMQILPMSFARAKEAAENHVICITVQKYSENHLFFSFSSWIMDEPWGGSDFQQPTAQTWAGVNNLIKTCILVLLWAIQQKHKILCVHLIIPNHQWLIPKAHPHLKMVVPPQIKLL